MASAGNLFDGPGSEPKTGWITAFCDGGSRGNPGPAGFGVYIQGENGAKIAELSEFLGAKTNNFAEYSGLLAALDYALMHGHTHLRVVADSELMVKQIKVQYRVRYTKKPAAALPASAPFRFSTFCGKRTAAPTSLPMKRWTAAWAENPQEIQLLGRNLRPSAGL